MTELDHLWPDEDRRANGLLRVGVACERDYDLTTPEKRCLTAAAAGLRRRETATVLGLSPHTVDRQLTTSRRKLQAKNTTHAVAEAIRRGDIP